MNIAHLHLGPILDQIQLVLRRSQLGIGLYSCTVAVMHPLVATFHLKLLCSDLRAFLLGALFCLLHVLSQLLQLNTVLFKCSAETWQNWGL